MDGRAAVPLSVGWGAGSPSNTMWPRSRPISVRSGILIHPTVWSQYTNVTDRKDRQDSESLLVTIAQKRSDIDLWLQLNMKHGRRYLPIAENRSGLSAEISRRYRRSRSVRRGDDRNRRNRASITIVTILAWGFPIGGFPLGNRQSFGGNRDHRLAELKTGQSTDLLAGLAELIPIAAYSAAELSAL